MRPKSLKYLGSCISDPEVQEVNIHRVFEVDDYEPEDGEEEEGEGEGDENED